MVNPIAEEEGGDHDRPTKDDPAGAGHRSGPPSYRNRERGTKVEVGEFGETNGGQSGALQQTLPCVCRFIEDLQAQPESKDQPSCCQSLEVHGAPLLHHGRKGQHKQRGEQRPTPGATFLGQALNLPTAGHQHEPWHQMDTRGCASHCKFNGRQAGDDLWTEGEIQIHVEGLPPPSAEVTVGGLKVVGLVPKHGPSP